MESDMSITVRTLKAPRAAAQEPVRPEPEPVRQQAVRAEVPKIDAKEILSSTGLQMVETNASKARQPLPDPEPMQLGRPRRERPRR